MRRSASVLAILVPLTAGAVPTDLSAPLYAPMGNDELGDSVGTFAFDAVGALHLDTDCGVIDAAPLENAASFGVRRVDPLTGIPIPGEPVAGDQALFDAICATTRGGFSALFGGASAPPELADRCYLDIFNSNYSLDQVLVPNPDNPEEFIPLLPFPVTPANAYSVALSGSSVAASVVITGFTGQPAPPLVHLNREPADGVGSGYFGPTLGLGAYLTDQQEALLGCGPYYGTDCDDDGIDLFNAEASVLVRSFPSYEPNDPVAARLVPGTGLVTLPGARGPLDPSWDPLVDGCPSAGDDATCALSNPRPNPTLPPLGARTLVNPLTGEAFRDELGAASFNFLMLLAAVSLGPMDADCSLDTMEGLLGCDAVRAFYEHTQRVLDDDPTGPPRRRWLWERSTDYAITSATGDLAPFGAGTLRVVGPEVARFPGFETGIGFSLFGVENAATPSCFPMPELPLDLEASQPLLRFYGAVPEPGTGAAASVTLGALALVARRGSRRSHRAQLNAKSDSAHGTSKVARASIE